MTDRTKGVLLLCEVVTAISLDLRAQSTGSLHQCQSIAGL